MMKRETFPIAKIYVPTERRKTRDQKRGEIKPGGTGVSRIARPCSINITLLRTNQWPRQRSIPAEH